MPCICKDLDSLYSLSKLNSSFALELLQISIALPKYSIACSYLPTVKRCSPLWFHCSTGSSLEDCTIYHNIKSSFEEVVVCPILSCTVFTFCSSLQEFINDIIWNAIIFCG